MTRKARAEGAKASRPRVRRAPAADKGTQNAEISRGAAEIQAALGNVGGGPGGDGLNEPPAEAGGSGGWLVGKPPANPVPGDDGEALSRIAASFQARFPAEWDAMRLCPLVHGLEEMSRLMKGKG
jgi:hypothetical protein